LEEGATIVGCGGYAVRAAEGEADLCWGMVHGSRHGRGYGRLLSGGLAMFTRPLDLEGLLASG
jgi:hypothetical protein